MTIPITGFRLSGLSLRLFHVTALHMSLMIALTLSAHPATASVFLIGNSLTWDTNPQLLEDAQWSVFCGKNLQSIADQPGSYCVNTSLRWDEALTQNTYDYVTVQPFAGTTRAQDVSIISNWMQLQPNAIFVLHTGWRGAAEHVQAYLSTGRWTMSPSEAYFDALEQDLAALHPGREIRRTRAAQVLYDIASDIDAGQAPFDTFQDLYRDNIHMSYGHGRYLMHNLMRLALDQDYILTPNEQANAQQQYLNAKLAALVPEPISLTLLLAAMPLCLRRTQRVKLT